MKTSQKYLVAMVLSLIWTQSAWSYSTQWMARVVSKHPCLESLGSVVSSESTCWSWAKRETTRPLYLASVSQILVGGSDGFLHVVDAGNGKTTSRVALDGNLLTAPLMDETQNILVVTTDRGVVYGLKGDDRTELWKTQVDSGILQSAKVSEHIVLVTQLGTLYSLSIKTGELIWSQKRELPNRIFLRHLSSPIEIESRVSGSVRKVLALGNPNGKLEFRDSEKGRLLDEIQIGNTKEPYPDVASSPVQGDGVLYAAAFNNGIYAVDALSRVQKWKIDEKGISQLALASGVLVAAGAKIVVGVNAQTGNILWRFDFTKGAPGNIVINRGEVFVGSDIDGLYVLDLYSGMPKQILGSGLGFAGGIVSVEDNLLAMSSSGALFMFSEFDQVVSARSNARK